MRFCSLYTCCSNLRQGSLCQLSLAESGPDLFLGAFVCDIREGPLSSLSSSPRQRILWLSQGHWLLGESFSQEHAGGSLLIRSTADESRLRVTPFPRSVLRSFRRVLSTVDVC